MARGSADRNKKNGTYVSHTVTTLINMSPGDKDLYYEVLRKLQWNGIYTESEEIRLWEGWSRIRNKNEREKETTAARGR